MTAANKLRVIALSDVTVSRHIYDLFYRTWRSSFMIRCEAGGLWGSAPTKAGK